MRFTEWIKKHEDCVIAGITVLALALFFGLAFDFYYELNDDVLMKDILAGVYNGTPESHNIQMLWLLSGFLSLCYRILPVIPWYGLFLCVCQFGFIGILICGAMRYCGSRKAKIHMAVCVGIISAGFLAEHFVMVQYTITTTCLVAGAAFLFYMIPEDADRNEFMRTGIYCVLLVFLAFLLRSEMTALMLPLVGVTGVLRWSREKEIFAKENLLRYFAVIGGILLALVVGLGSNKIAYSSDGWKTFCELFDNRTELYDFQYIPEYEANQDFYRSIGLAKEQVTLLENYNYGLDERIDEKVLGEVAKYAAAGREEDLIGRLIPSLRMYVYRSTHREDWPWNAVVAALYLAAFLGFFAGEQKNGKVMTFWSALWRLGILFAGRSALWMFILVRGRAPVRITHSLYLMEAVILFAVILTEYGQKRKGNRFFEVLMYVLLGAFFLLLVPGQIASVADRCEHQDRINEKNEALIAYEKEHPDCFYFEDVYTSIYYAEAFNQKMFRNVDRSPSQMELLGGWFCKSPAYDRKMAAHGITEADRSLAESDQILFVCELEADLNWLTDYYELKGTPVQVSLVDEVASYFGIYQVNYAK